MTPPASIPLNVNVSVTYVDKMPAAEAVDRVKAFLECCYRGELNGRTTLALIADQVDPW